MGLAVATGWTPEYLLGWDWEDLLTLADVVEELNGRSR